MSWKERVESGDIEITTGDNKIYTFLYKNASREYEVNYKVYEFIDVEGSFVDRKRLKGSKIPMKCFIVGEDCLDIQDEFIESMSNEGVWQVYHPMYGRIQGYGTKVSFNNDGLNVVEVDIDFIETNDIDTIIDTNINSYKVISDVNSSLTNTSVDFGNKFEFNPSNLSLAKENINNINTKLENINDDDGLVSSLKNKINNVLYTTTIIETPIQYMNLVQSYIRLIPLRVNSINESFDLLMSSFNELTTQNKYMYESMGVSIISNMVLSVDVFFNDFKLKQSVEKTSEDISTTYNQFKQKINDNTNISYQPNRYVLTKLENAVLSTLSKLLKLSIKLLVEVNILLPEDMNFINAVYKYSDFSKLEDFKAVNNINKSEVFRLKKDRNITIYK